MKKKEKKKIIKKTKFFSKKKSVRKIQKKSFPLAGSFNHLGLDAKSVGDDQVLLPDSTSFLRDDNENTSFQMPVNSRLSRMPINSTLSAADEVSVEYLKFSRLSTHLANDRTFLAWIRTTASIFAVGFGILKSEKLFQFTLDWYDKLIGFMFCIAGVLCLCFGVSRYIVVKRSLMVSKKFLRQGLRRVSLRLFAALIFVCYIVMFARCIICTLF